MHQEINLASELDEVVLEDIPLLGQHREGGSILLESIVSTPEIEGNSPISALAPPTPNPFLQEGERYSLSTPLSSPHPFQPSPTGEDHKFSLLAGES